MCGIFGCVSVSDKTINYQIIKKGLDSLNHRGKDDTNILKFDNVILGHKRLSIIDLKTNAAKQPVLSHSSLLAFNGMIYNFLELKNELLKEKIIFKGNSDTEVLAKSLDYWGLMKTLKKIDGMFAFVWFCKKERQIYLVRDPMGEKPLYWLKKNNEVYFSSEIKAFLKINSFSKKPNLNFIDDYLYTSVINGSKTIYSEANEVDPGSIIKISTLTQSINSKSYFSVENTFYPKSLKYTNEANLKKCIEDSVISRCISDVPFGMLLSGGLDSSLILSLLMKNELTSKIKCYFADTKNQKLSEFNDVDRIKDFLIKKYKKPKLSLTLGKINFSNYINLLQEVTESFDEPVHFSNSPHLLQVCKKASKEGVKVLLSGEGSDELFFGYDRFIDTYKYLKKMKSEKDKIEKIYYGGGQHSVNCVKKLCEFTKGTKEKSLPWIWLEQNIKKHSLEDLILMFSQKFRLQTLLKRQDRLGMSCGIEARVPFLSRKLIKNANSIPFKYKFDKKSNNTKLILKLISKDLVPNQIIEKQKIGFNTDMISWIREDKMRTLIKNIINDKNGFFNSYLNGKYASEIVERHFNGQRYLDTLVWNMFSLEVWHRLRGEGDSNFFYK